MRKVMAIATRELHQYFSTWNAYIVAAVVLLIDGLLFNTMALGTSSRLLSTQVLESFFYFSSGVIMIAGVLLSAKLIAEERQNKTDILLLSSPISERQIVYGKFISIALFLTFLLIISAYMPALIFVNGKVSISHILVGYLGVFLLGSAVASLTMFASSLVASQWLAATLASVFTTVFVVLWMLSEQVGSPYKEIYSYLAIHNNHFRGFKVGLLRVQDVVFYLSFIIFFLECSAKAMQARYWRS